MRRHHQTIAHASCPQACCHLLSTCHLLSFVVLFLQDGTIGMDIKLTGILSTSLLSPGEEQPSHGILVGAGDLHLNLDHCKIVIKSVFIFT